MGNEQIFKTHLAFKSVSHEMDNWRFEFADKTFFNSIGFWRLLEKGQIKFVSFDEGQQFGLPQPLNLVEKINEKLTEKSLLEIKIRKDTTDLLLTLTDDIQIEIFVSSSGYESYNFTLGNKQYIGHGSGNISVFEKS